MRLTFVLLALAASCASDAIPGPPAGLPYAAATPGCGPADGPATVIYLSSNPVESLDPSTPFVRIAIWQSLDRVGARSWSVADGAASALYFSTPDEFEVATGGSVTVTAVDPDSTVCGSAVFTFPTQGRVAGGFHAGWFPVALRCG
jgi:ABC-type transport system substrate-binding protein